MELMLCLVRKKYMRRYCRSQEESYLILFLEMFWKSHIFCSPAELRQLPGQDHRGGLWKDWGQWFGCEGIENCWAEIRIFCCMSVTDSTFLQLSSIYLKGRSQKMGLTKYFCSGRNLPIWPFSVKISPIFLSWLPEVNITSLIWYCTGEGRAVKKQGGVNAEVHADLHPRSSAEPKEVLRS